MRPAPESLSLRTRLLQGLSTLAILGLILVPLYLLLNQYWKSLVLITAGYGMLGFAFLRLGRLIRRVMRRAPAEIPPWQTGLLQAPTTPVSDLQFAAAEAIQHTSTDPYYLQEVLKPRLRQLLAYRLQGSPQVPPETLEATQLSHLEPAVLDFLQRDDSAGLWSKYRHRRRRVQDVLIVLRYLETL